MKCLFFASWWPVPESPVSGIFIREHADAVSFFSKIVVVHFKPIRKIVRPWNFPFRMEVSFNNDNGKLIYIVTINVALRRFGFYRYAMKKAMEKFLKQLHQKYSFDLININILRSEFAELLIEENMLPGLPIVISENSSYYYSEIKLLDGKEREQKRNHLIQLLNSVRVKKILPVSSHLAQTFINEYKVNPEMISIVPNIASDDFHYNNSGSINENCCKIVLVAHWVYPKNPFAFLNYLNRLSAEELSHFKIDWFGDGPQMEEIKLLAEKISAPAIIFHGYQSKAVIAKYLKEANFLFHPSDKENLPCIVIESICSGTPVLSNNVSGVNELIDESNGILIPINDETALSEAIKIMMAKQQQFDRQKISDTARKKFSKEVVGARICSVYKETLN